jgi:uncharacterized membrane protein HdeD (DUF308 family)
MDFTTYLLLGAVIAGITELLNRLRAKDYWVAATIISSAIVGGLFGWQGIEGLDVVTGLAAGFGTSGVIKTISAFGNKSTPAPSTVLER